MIIPTSRFKVSQSHGVWYIERKVLGLFWYIFDCDNRFGFVSPFADEVLLGYDSLKDALEVVKRKLGSKNWEKWVGEERIEIIYENNKHFKRGYNIIGTTHGYSVVGGVYEKTNMGETFIFDSSKVAEYTTVEEAIMKSELVGIRIDNKSRWTSV